MNVPDLASLQLAAIVDLQRLKVRRVYGLVDGVGVHVVVMIDWSERAVVKAQGLRIGPDPDIVAKDV